MGSENVSILGINFNSTVVANYSVFAELLKRVGKIRFLINEPTPEILKMLAFRSTSM